MKRKRKVALVLGGGGALGFAHVGVLDVLQQYGVPVDAVIGTSMGAVVGAGYCSGKSIEDIVDLSTEMTIRKMFDLNLNMTGLVSGKKISRFLGEVYGHKNIEDLPTKFVCNAVDLVTCQQYFFESGDLVTAVRSSMSVPAVFAPVKYRGMVLVDGGILDNMPCDYAHELGYDVVIAVDVISKSVLVENVRSLFGSVIQSCLLMQQELQRIKDEKCDVLITPDLHDHKQYVFTKETTEDIIEKGRLATIEAMPQIAKALRRKGIKIDYKKVRN